MSVVMVTGSAGLIGSEAVEFYVRRGFDVAGIDNNMRRYFFGAEGSTLWNRRRLEALYGAKYRHFETDIRDREGINRIFAHYSDNLSLIIHTAAQPSHDWAAREPLTDFGVNAAGTLNLLEAMRKYSPGAVFVYLSTNKVYGDRPNGLPPGGAGHAVGDRPLPSLPGRHTRRYACGPVSALFIRSLQAGSGSNGAGIRKIAST